MVTPNQVLGTCRKILLNGYLSEIKHRMEISSK